jgi:hypothetical protein
MPQRKHSFAETAGIVVANVVKLTAAVLTVIEIVGQARPVVLGGTTFLLTIGLSLESSVRSFFGGKE